MRVVLKGINIKVDESKLDIDLTHEYHIPDTDVTVVCKYLRTGERDKVAELTRNGTLVTASRTIFAEQVKEIKGLVIENEFNNDIQEIIIKKPSDFLALPRCDEFDLILNSTLVHLLSADNLTEEEEKNSALDTNA